MPNLFRVPQRAHHAVVIMLELAAVPRDGSVLALDELGRRTGISQGFLEQVVAPLRRAGLVVGQRGKRGGYRLAKPARSVTVADVMAAFVDDAPSVVECVGVNGHCAASANCASRRLWCEVQGALDRSLAKLRLSDFIARPKKARVAKP